MNAINNSNITTMTDAEIEQVDGAWGLAVLVAVVAVVGGIIYIGGELHDATCKDH